MFSVGKPSKKGLFFVVLPLPTPSSAMCPSKTIRGIASQKKKKRKKSLNSMQKGGSLDTSIDDFQPPK